MDRPTSIGWRLSATALIAICVWGVAPLGAKESPAPSTMKAAPGRAPVTMSASQALTAYDRSLNYLVRAQNKDGSWAAAIPGLSAEASFSVETHYAWKYTSHALAVMAFLHAPETTTRRAALLNGIRWMVRTRMPKRGNHWDTDYMWPALYGVVCLTQVAEDKRFGSDGELSAHEQWLLRRRGRTLLTVLLKNQSPEGGWAYYDDPPYSRRNKWSTSFCTALILPYLIRAKELGWGVDQATIERARVYVEKCQLPEGAYAYDLTPWPRLNGGQHINRIKGSLGRTPLCDWSLLLVGSKRVTIKRLRAGIDAFFKHHRFLDVARLRPNPHEAYYANSGYFYCFGHYYAAHAINLLPEAQREAYHARLRPHVIKTLRKDGSTSDFTNARNMRVASTAYCALALGLGLLKRR